MALINFKAIPYPIRNQHLKDRLIEAGKAAIVAARGTSDAEKKIRRQCMDEIFNIEEQIRGTEGVEFIRPAFLPSCVYKIAA